MSPELIINASALDLELCELLGENHADFLILCFDGEPFKVFGTPFDSPAARQKKQWLVDGLNDHSEKSWWPELWKNWKSELSAQYNLPEEVAAADPRPVASYHVSRVCPAYSQNLHVAIQLFEKLTDRIADWIIHSGAALSGTTCRHYVEVISETTGDRHAEESDNLAEAIALVIKRLLIAEQPHQT